MNEKLALAQARSKPCKQPFFTSKKFYSSSANRTYNQLIFCIKYYKPYAIVIYDSRVRISRNLQSVRLYSCKLPPQIIYKIYQFFLRDN